MVLQQELTQLTPLCIKITIQLHVTRATRYWLLLLPIITQLVDSLHTTHITVFHPAEDCLHLNNWAKCEPHPDIHRRILSAISSRRTNSLLMPLNWLMLRTAEDYNGHQHVALAKSAVCNFFSLLRTCVHPSCFRVWTRREETVGRRPFHAPLLLH